MKAIVKFSFSLMLAMTVSMVFTSCGSNTDPETTNPGGIAPNDPKQRILGTWKCNDTDGYTVITFKDTGVSDWKYLFDNEITRWSLNYEINDQKLIIYEDGERTEYTYTLTSTTLKFDGDEYVKIENYVDEPDPIEGGTQADNQYDNRGAVAKQFRGGGTKSNPYIISDATELRKLADDVEGGKTYRDEYFKMTADVIVNKRVVQSSIGELAVSASSLEQWKPIGKGLTPFCGTFDGDGHTISGIFIQKADRDSLGLFGYLAGTIMNVKIEDSYVEGKNHIGGLVGVASLKNYSKDYVPTISSCISFCVIKGSSGGLYQGGMAGYLKQGTIQRCLNYGVINGYRQVGGIVGHLGASIAIDCANYGPINGYSYYVGGVVGVLGPLKPENKYIYSSLYNCYNFGTIMGERTVGGIIGNVGRTGGNGTISNIVNYGKVQIQSDKSSIGALVGAIDKGAALTKGYFLETSYPKAAGTSTGSGTPTDVQSMTSKQMKAQTFLNDLNKNAKALGSSYSQWKFGIDGFPIFEWVKE